MHTTIEAFFGIPEKIRREGKLFSLTNWRWPPVSHDWVYREFMNPNREKPTLLEVDWSKDASFKV